MVAPFPYFGGKRTVVDDVWERFGDVKGYVEPFFGGGAVMLGRPHWDDERSAWHDGDIFRAETVNDLNGYLTNFWRAVQGDAEGVARWATWPVSELDLHARHRWLVLSDEGHAFCERMRVDPDYYDVKVAGWWVWGQSNWLGGGWCSEGRAHHRVIPAVSSHRGVIGLDRRGALGETLQRLQDRLRHVKVLCGDWTRAVSPVVMDSGGITGVFLDPPYVGEGRDVAVYAEDSGDVAHAVRDWAVVNGDNPRLRIAYCGYEDAVMPDGWTCFSWQANGGMGNQRKGEEKNENKKREKIWFSPHCVKKEELQLAFF